MIVPIFRNLTLFAIFTSCGYVALSVFLPKASAGFLLLNTYCWLFAFRIFSKGWRNIRWPPNSLRVVVDTRDLLFAGCVFGYWSLFWFGIKNIPDEQNAAQSAVAFLALNSVLLPIASHFATARAKR